MPVPKGMGAIPVTIGVTADEKQLVESTMRTAIAKLGPGIDQMEVNVTNVTGEWQGVKYIPNAKSQRWSHEDQFAELCKDTMDGPVVLYLHGGRYIMGGPDTHRAM